MKHIRFSLLLFLACAAAAPCAFAQKSKSLIKAAESLAGRGARETARAEASALAARGASAGITAPAREEMLRSHTQAVPELASALKELSYQYSARGKENVQFLIASKVKDPELKAELAKLVKARQIREALALLESRSMKVFSFPSALLPEQKGTLSALDSRLCALDFSRGPDVALAARLLAEARQNNLISRPRYLAMLAALERSKPEQMFKILRREIPPALTPDVEPAHEAKLWKAIQLRERWDDLTPREMTLPPAQDKFRHAAIRKVIGKRAGGQKNHLPFYKEYYDKQPVWVQAELDAQIDELTQALTDAYARNIGLSQYRDERRSFLSQTESFFSGRMQQSPASLEYLYSAHVPAALKEELKRYIGALPQDKAGRDAFYAKAREFYDVFTQNRSAGRVFASAAEEETLSALQNMLTVRGLPKNTPQAAETIAVLKRSADPVAAECARRAEAALQSSSLASQTLEELQRYVAQNNALPPSTGRLYLRMLHFKNYPGPLQAEFNGLFEKYRRRDGRSPGRPRK